MLSPNRVKKPLTLQESELIRLLGWTEEEFHWFEGQKARFSDIRPGDPVAFDVFTAIILVVVGVILNFVAQALTPVNKPGTPARLEQKTVDGQNIVSSSRFAPTSGFDSQQNVVEMGSIVPVVFANRETIEGVTYGGIRVSTNLLWSQLISLGGSQLIKALFLVGYGPIDAIDPRQFAIGDNLLNGYELETAGNTAGRLSFYYRAGDGRVRSTDLIAGRAAANDIANSENDGGADVFQIRGVNGVMGSDFCYASQPSTQTTFGVYAPIGNDLGYRLNPQIRSISVAQLKAVGDSGDAIVLCADDAQLQVERIKQNLQYSTRSGITGYNGSPTTNGTVYTATVGQEIEYRLYSSSDYRTKFTRQTNDGPEGELGCEDIAQAVSGLQRSWDDALIVGEKYKIGECIAILTERSPADAVFSSEADFDPPGGGQPIVCTFKFIKGGKFQAASAAILETDGEADETHRYGTNGCHVFRLAVANFTLERPAQVIEIGFRSTLGLRASGLCNFSSTKSYGDADFNSCERFLGRRISKGNVLTTTQYQNGTYTGPEVRYSFHRIGFRTAGSTSDYTYLPQLFGFRSLTQQPTFNYIRIQFPSSQRWEVQILPVTGWEIAEDILSGELHVLDSKIQTRRTVFGAGCAIEYNGEQVPRIVSTFELPFTQANINLAPMERFGKSYVDPLGRLAEVFNYAEVTASTASAEHEISYVNIISRNAEEPLYNSLSKLGATIQSGPEFRSFQQLSIYINQGYDSTHLIGDVLRHFLANSEFGLGEIVAPAQWDDQSFDDANTWTYARRYFFDAGVSEPFNFRQQGAVWAEYFLHDLLVRNGKFYLQPIALFDEAHTIGALYTAGNVSEFELTVSDPADRTPPRISVRWREEKQTSDVAERGLFPVVREVLVREAGTPDDAPLEAIDLASGLNNFCTNETHAIDVAKMACRKRRLITNRVRLVTRPDLAGFDPGKIIKVGMETVTFTSPNNGAVLADGTVVSVPTDGGSEPLADGTYDVLLWTGSGNVQEVSLDVSGGVNNTYPGSVFTIADVGLSSQTYKIQTVAFTPEGDVEMEATEFPLDENNFSLLTAGWNVPGNWVIEGAIGSFDDNVTVVPTFTGVTILGLSTAPEGATETYTASVSGPSGSYTYAWTCVGATVDTASASFADITFPTDGSYTVQVSVTYDGNTIIETLDVVVGEAAPTLTTIGTVTVTGSASPVIGIAESYGASRSGDSTDTAWEWSATAADPIVTPSGATADFTFDVLGANEVRASATSDSSSDSPKNDLLAVTVVAQTIGTVTIAGPTGGSALTDYSYTVSRSGNSVGTSWAWACPGATLTGTGASRTINFPTAGSYTITVTATAANASDSPAVDTHVVVIT